MAHAIKINRACELTKFGPRAEAEILGSIPRELVGELTGRQLAVVMRALDAHWHKAQVAERHAIVDEGVVWSEREGRLRELAV